MSKLGVRHETPEEGIRSHAPTGNCTFVGYIGHADALEEALKTIRRGDVKSSASSKEIPS